MQRTCKTSGQSFAIDERDLQYYQKLGVPPPTLCPDERARRRLAWRSRAFFMRNCDNCGKRAFSWMPTTSPVRVFCEHCFQEDSFDATEYGRPFDFTLPFFPQFEKLLAIVPRHISNATMNENCEYIISAHQNRDCYMTDECDYSRECYFGYTLQRATNIVEGLYVHDSEIGYQLIHAEKCYRVFFSQNVFHCSDSAFLRNCRSCKHCLFCTNLRNKEYCIFNQPVEPAVFEREWQRIFQMDAAVLAHATEEFEQFVRSQPMPAGIIIQCEDCRGDYLLNCKDVTDCYSVDNSRDCRYCTDIHNSRDCYDTNIYEGELMYECNHAGPEAYRNLFCHINWFSSDIYYCVDSRYIKNCFGCISLKKEEFCILNTRYSELEYRSLLKRIISHMRETGEWGEFFPITFSPVPYNITLAQLFYPLTPQEAMVRGLPWLSSDDELQSSLRPVPPTLAEVESVSFQTAFSCAQTGKGFRFIQPELRFYREHGLPAPSLSPLARIDALWKRLGPRKLFEHACHECGVAVSSSIEPGGPYHVVCDSCYLALVH